MKLHVRYSKCCAATHNRIAGVSLEHNGRIKYTCATDAAGLATYAGRLQEVQVFAVAICVPPCTAMLCCSSITQVSQQISANQLLDMTLLPVANELVFLVSYT
jgi:hypothetical protein